MHQPLLAVLAIGCAVAATLWGRSSTRLQRAWRRSIAAAAAASAADRPEIADSERAAADLARSAFRKEVHTTVLYAAIAACTLSASFTAFGVWQLPYVLVLIPIGISLRYGP